MARKSAPYVDPLAWEGDRMSEIRWNLEQGWYDAENCKIIENKIFVYPLEQSRKYRAYWQNLAHADSPPEERYETHAPGYYPCCICQCGTYDPDASNGFMMIGDNQCITGGYGASLDDITVIYKGDRFQKDRPVCESCLRTLDQAGELTYAYNPIMLSIDTLPSAAVAKFRAASESQISA